MAEAQPELLATCVQIDRIIDGIHSGDLPANTGYSFLTKALQSYISCLGNIKITSCFCVILPPSGAINTDQLRSEEVLLAQQTIAKGSKFYIYFREPNGTKVVREEITTELGLHVCKLLEQEKKFIQKLSIQITDDSYILKIQAIIAALSNNSPPLEYLYHYKLTYIYLEHSVKNMHYAFMLAKEFLLGPSKRELSQIIPKLFARCPELNMYKLYTIINSVLYKQVQEADIVLRQYNSVCDNKIGLQNRSKMFSQLIGEYQNKLNILIAPIDNLLELLGKTNYISNPYY